MKLLFSFVFCILLSIAFCDEGAEISSQKDIFSSSNDAATDHVNDDLKPSLFNAYKTNNLRPIGLSRPVFDTADESDYKSKTHINAYNANNMSPNGLPFGWKSRPAHKFNNAMLWAYNANNMSPTGWRDNDEKNSDVKSNSDDVADESDDVAYDSDDVADESDDVAYDSDDVADESDDVAYDSDDVADESDDVAYDSDDVADDNDEVSDESEDDRIKRRDGYGYTEVADENDDVADENDDVADENDDVDDDDDDDDDQEELTYHYIVYDQNNDEQGYPDEVIEQIIADDLD